MSDSVHGGEVASGILARAFCHRMQYFLDQQLSDSALAGRPFPPNVVAGYVESSEFRFWLAGAFSTEAQARIKAIRRPFRVGRSAFRPKGFWAVDSTAPGNSYLHVALPGRRKWPVETPVFGSLEELPVAPPPPRPGPKCPNRRQARFLQKESVAPFRGTLQG